MTAPLLEVKNLSVNYGDLSIVKDVSFCVDCGQWLMVTGPNGAGKSTVINAISQGTAYDGSTFLDSRDIKKYKPAKLSQNVGVLSQSHFVSYSFTVGEVVRLGRYAHSSSIFKSSDIECEKYIEEALEITGMTELKNQSVLTLSGGELQRTFLAQLFAQNPRLLILDEPTNHLDLVYQKQIFALLSKWLSSGDRAIISVVHDLSLAKAYGTHALLLNKGRCAAFGTAQEVFTPENLNSAYSMNVYDWFSNMLSQWNIQE